MSDATKLRELLSSKLTIPTLPEVVLKVQELIEDPDVGTREIGELVAEDAPLAAKVLRVANSAYYGLPGRCISAEHACTVLGVQALRNIITQVAVMQAFSHLYSESVFDIQEIWDHSILTAKLSSFLAERVQHHTQLNPAEFYICGLLHDIGKIVLLDALDASYVPVLEEARMDDTDLIELEQREFGFDHATVGAYVSHQWGLPEVVRRSVEFHHGLLEEVEKNAAAAIVYASNFVVNEAPRKAREEILAFLEGPAVRALGLSEEDARAVLDFALNAGPDGDEEGSWAEDPWGDEGQDQVA